MRRLLLVISLFLSGPASAQFIGEGFFGQATGAAPVMITPILALQSSTTLPATGTTVNYTLFDGHGAASTGTWSASAVGKAQPSAVAGTVANLTVNLPQPLTSGTWTFSMYKTSSGTAQALTCTIDSAGGNPGDRSCSDTTHTVSVAAGTEIIGWKSTPNNPGSGVANTTFQLAATFTSTSSNESPLFVGGSACSTTVVDYFGFMLNRGCNATELNIASLAPAPGVLDKMYVALATSTGAGAGRQYVVYQNGNPAPSGCSVGTTCLGCAVGASATTCNDTTHTVTLAAGDTISVQECPYNTATCPAGSAPAASIVNMGFRWVPTNAGEAMLFQGMNTAWTATSGSIRYGGMAGAVTGSSTTETDTYGIVPKGITSITVKNFRVNQSPAPGTTATRAYVVRSGTGSGQASSSVGCTVTSAATGCTDSNQVVLTPGANPTAGTFFNLMTTPAVANSAALTYQNSSAVVTVQP